MFHPKDIIVALVNCSLFVFQVAAKFLLLNWDKKLCLPVMTEWFYAWNGIRLLFTESHFTLQIQDRKVKTLGLTWKRLIGHLHKCCYLYGGCVHNAPSRCFFIIVNVYAWPANQNVIGVIYFRNGSANITPLNILISESV